MFFGVPYLLTMLLSNCFEALKAWDYGGIEILLELPSSNTLWLLWGILTGFSTCIILLSNYSSAIIKVKEESSFIYVRSLFYF